LDLVKHDRPTPVDEQQPSVDDLTRALGDALTAIRAVGPDRIELVTVTKDRICLQPADLEDGEQIAHALGCDLPLDHRMFVPGHTLWTGTRYGMEIQVRSVLRASMAVES
jgi:hypothetical protein